MNTFNLEDTFFNVINAILSDEKENLYFVSLYNCRMHQSSFSIAGNTFGGYFDYALFSKQRHFNSETDKIRNKVNVYINTWAEFCFPQDTKTRASFQSIMSEIKLKNKMKISFNQDIKSHFLSKNNIFNSLFVNLGLSKQEVGTIEKELNRVLILHREDIGIKKAENHKWFIQIENIPQTIGVDIVGYYLGVLIGSLMQV